MKKIGESKFFPVLVLGMLTMLIVSCGIYVSTTTNPSMQSLGNSPVMLQTMDENNILRWNTTWGGPNTDDGNGVALDASGSIYCVGSTNSFGAGSNDFALVKFAPTGTKVWNTTWGGTSEDTAYRVAVDANNSIYCIGRTFSFGAGGFDFALVKYAPNGAKLWNTTWGGTGNDYGKGVAVDTNGSIYCSGYSDISGTSYDFALVKFAPNGMKLWNITWGGTSGDYGEGVAVDTSGSIYCIGSTYSFGAGYTDFALVKVAPNGTKLWNTTWGGTGFDDAYGVAVDISGAAYCVGETESFGAGGDDFALVKFAPNGTKLWNTTWGGANPNYCYGVALDASGSIYCVGETDSLGGVTSDFALVKYDSKGTKLWDTIWGGSSYDYGYGVAVDASGSVYCVGDTESFGAGATDLALVKFSIPAGGGPGDIPSFDFLYLLCGLVALIYLAQRRKSSRSLP